MDYRSKALSATASALLAIGAVMLDLRSASAADDLKIGVLLPFTGPWAKNGNESYVAMEIARDMINEQGGIGGRKIGFVRGDAPDPSAGKSEAERIISQEHVNLITGTYASPLGIAISAEAERRGVVHWETIASADIITKRGYKHVFQVGPAASRYGIAALDFTNDEMPSVSARSSPICASHCYGKIAHSAPPLVSAPAPRDGARGQADL